MPAALHRRARGEPGRIAMAQGGKPSSTKSASCRSLCRSSCCRAAAAKLAGRRQPHVARRPSHRRRDQLNLENAVQAGTFREDLYYRLNVIHLTVPSLRERPEDVPLWFTTFLAPPRRSSSQPGRRGVARSSPLLAEYHWPGNVRELENTIERAVLLCAGPQIEPRDLPSCARLGGEKRIAARLPDAGIDLRQRGRHLRESAHSPSARRTQWNKKQAAGCSTERRPSSNAEAQAHHAALPELAPSARDLLWTRPQCVASTLPRLPPSP